MYKLFSVDDHIVEHGTVWSDRVPARYRDRAPHIVEEDGFEWWVYEDQRGATTGLNAVAGKPREYWNMDPMRFDDMIRGCFDPRERAKDFLANGILASVGFPTLPRFGGVLFNEFKDKDLADACVRAYNDFVLDEWCPSGPDGLYVPMVIVQLWNPQAAAAEIERCVAKGAKALCFPENTVPLGLPSFYTDHWDPVWAAAQDADIPVCMHIGSSGVTTIPSPDAPETLMIALGMVPAIVASMNLMMSPVPRKFERIKLVFSEGGIGWLPAALERADRQFERHREWTSLKDLKPSEIFARNMHLCMLSEPVGLEMRHVIGVDRITWECDYPHADTPWPDAQAEADATFAGLPNEEVEAITHGNAERLFNWTMADPSLADLSVDRSNQWDPAQSARRSATEAFEIRGAHYVPKTATAGQ